MDVEKIRKEKISSVLIDYAYDSDEWQNISIRYQNGMSAGVSRDQIATFLRMEKIVKDLQEVEQLRNQLFRLFGTQPLAPSTP